jgi:hypothetical protein
VLDWVHKYKVEVGLTRVSHVGGDQENLKAVIAQLKYWIDAGVQNWETRALLGLSTQNCRIESLWKHVREQVCDFFSSTFHSMAQQGIYCPSSEIDRWYLHQTFLPLIQVCVPGVCLLFPCLFMLFCLRCVQTYLLVDTNTHAVFSFRTLIPVCHLEYIVVTH